MIHGRKTAKGPRYDVRLRDPAGRVYTRTFTTKREAQTFEAQELADKSRGAWIDPRKSVTTFGELADYWLRSNPGKRSSALARDESIVRLHLGPMLGARPVGTITPNDVQALVITWSAQKAARTTKRQYGVLRAILNAAVACDLIARSPCRGIKLPGVAHIDRHIVTAEELAALGDVVGSAYRPMVYLGAVLGLRWGECAGLRVGRVDFLRATLLVAEQLTRGVRGMADQGAPKSAAGRRTLAVPAPLMAMLAEHLAARSVTGADADARVFAAPGGGDLDYSHFRRRVWLPAVAAIGLDGLTFHDLRRANATGLVRVTDIKTAQTRLGHSDPRLTLAIYAQAVTAADEAAADQLGDLFMPLRGRSPRDGRAMGHPHQSGQGQP